jgi:hypothetical protein
MAAAFVAAGTACRAEEYVAKQGPASLHVQGVRIEPERLTARLSDKLRVTFHVEGPAGLEVEQSERITSSADWEAELGRNPPSEASGWERTYSLTPLKVGALPLTFSSLRYREQPGTPWQEVKWQPVTVHISTEVLTTDLSDLQNPLVPEGPPESPAWWRPMVMPAVVLMGIAAAVWLRWFLEHKRKSLPVLPEQRAYKELDLLIQEPLDDDAAIVQFHTRLSKIIRVFLQEEFHLPAPARTTTELLAQLAKPNGMEFGNVTCEESRVKEILENCDLVKFAKAVPSPDACLATAAAARLLIRETVLTNGASSAAGGPAASSN